MKIRRNFRQAFSYVYLAPWPRRRLILAFLATGAGMYVSFALFHFLSLKGFEATKPPKLDTVYVQLLNGYPPTYLQARIDTVKRDTVLETFQRSLDSAKSFRARVIRPISRAIPLTPADVGKASQDARLSHPIFPWWVPVSGGLLLLFLLIYLILAKLPYYSEDMNRDLDPPGLTALFSEFGVRIESIGNPRKIKRLSNKIRFQYTYLFEKGYSDAELRGLIQTLLLFETKMGINVVSVSDIQTAMRLPENFRILLKQQRIDYTDRLANIIAALNRDAFL